jgi:hypothetical protein
MCCQALSWQRPSLSVSGALPLGNSQPSTAFATSSRKVWPVPHRAQDNPQLSEAECAVAVAIWAHSGLYLHHKPLRAAGETRE